MATNVDWYCLCVICSRGGMSGRIDGGFRVWVLGWVYGRGFCGCVFVKCVLLGYLDGIFLGQVNGCGLRVSVGVFLGNFEWTFLFI